MTTDTTEYDSKPDLSIVIVTLADDLSDVESYQQLSDQAATSELDVEFIIRCDSGICTARNAGIERARSDKIVFVDDDAEPHEGYLEAMHDSLSETPIVGGKVDHPNDGFYAELGNAPDPGEEEVLVGCNMGFRSEVFEQVGGFEEALDWGHDETELLDRAKPHFEVGYAEDAVVEHAYAEDAVDYWKKMWRFGPADVFYTRVTDSEGSGGDTGFRGVLGTLLGPSQFIASSARGTFIKSVGRVLRNVSIARAVALGDVPSSEESASSSSSDSVDGSGSSSNSAKSD